MNSARQLVDVEFAVEQQHVEPGHPEQVGKIGADRAGPDDRDVEILATAHLALNKASSAAMVDLAQDPSHRLTNVHSQTHEPNTRPVQIGSVSCTSASMRLAD